MADFTVHLHHDGLFITNPLQYIQGDHRVINDIKFEGMVFDELYHLIRRLVLVAPVTKFYNIRGQPLNIGLRPLATDEHVNQFVTTCFENGNEIDLYTEHNGYDDVLGMMRNDTVHDEVTQSEHSDDENENLNDVHDIVDFETEGEQQIKIPKITTDDPWLNKLVGKGNFIGYKDNPTPELNGRFIEEVDDPDEHMRCAYDRD